MKKLNLKLLLYSILLTIITACQPKPGGDITENNDQDTIPESINLIVKQDATQIDEAEVYTYRLLEDPAEPLADIPSVEKPAVSPAEVVEKTIQPAKKGKTKRPPLFSKDCLTREKPVECSHAYLSTFVDNYVEKKTIDTTIPNVKMYVSFVLDTGGQPEEATVKIEPQNAKCESCETIARELVEDMPDWVPGMIDGELKKSVVRFPVYFR